MHIGFRTSGGRGEYEVVGNSSGYTAASLEAWEFHMRWPDGTVRDTGLWLDPAGSGKPRLRSLLDRPIQIGKIISPMLLLPDPRRDFKSTPADWPIIAERKYSVTKVGFGAESEFSEPAGQVTFVPSWVEVANQADSEAIGVSERWERVTTVYRRIAELPDLLGSAIAEHRDYIANQTTIGLQLTRIVKDVSKELAQLPNFDYQAGGDPLPGIERLLDIEEPDEPGLPAPNILTDDEPEIAVRSAHQYRLAKVRGTSGRRFSREVRTAYNHTCAFCGATYGGIEGVRSGIDAAHILAWAKNNLDVIQNGIALCKLHHWAFDAGILLIHKDDEDYYTYFSSLAAKLDSLTLDRLGAHGERIPEAWLPVNPAHRPSAQYLERLYADLGVGWLDVD